MRAAFARFDSNADGMVDLGELMQAMEVIGKPVSGRLHVT